MKQFTTYCFTVKILLTTEALNVERAYNIIKMLNSNISLIKSIDAKAGRRSEFLLDLTQVVVKIRRVPPKYTRGIKDFQMNWVLRVMGVSPS